MSKLQWWIRDLGLHFLTKKIPNLIHNLIYFFTNWMFLSCKAQNAWVWVGLWSLNIRVFILDFQWLKLIILKWVYCIMFCKFWVGFINRWNWVVKVDFFLFEVSSESLKILGSQWVVPFSWLWNWVVGVESGSSEIKELNFLNFTNCRNPIAKCSSWVPNL